MNTNPTLQKLNQVIHQKESHLAISADLTERKAIDALVDQVKDHICVLKLHIDTVNDFEYSWIEDLRERAQSEQFLLFEDRKFADIGNTSARQYSEGLYHIANWADITNAHLLPGPGIVEGLKQVGLPLGRGLLLLAQMSCQPNYFTPEYTQACVDCAKAHSEFVIGFIAQQGLAQEDGFLTLSPGVSLSAKDDALGQRYRTVEEAICRDQVDIIIVGRDIIGHANPKGRAAYYQEQAYQAHCSK